MTVSEKMEIISYLESEFNDAGTFGRRNITELIKAAKVPKSTYYEYLNRKPSKSQLLKEQYLLEIEKIHKKSKCIYGALKINNELQKQFLEKCITVRTTSVYMTQLGIRSITVAKKKKNKVSPQQLTFNMKVINYLKFDRSLKPRTHLLTDITYIHTMNDGWVYLLSYMDLYTRKILCWDVLDTMKAEWVTKYAYKAIQLCPDCIYIHSDRGVQYTSKIYLETLLINGIAPLLVLKDILIIMHGLKVFTHN